MGDDVVGFFIAIVIIVIIIIVVVFVIIIRVVVVVVVVVVVEQYIYIGKGEERKLGVKEEEELCGAAYHKISGEMCLGF